MKKLILSFIILIGCLFLNCDSAFYLKDDKEGFKIKEISLSGDKNYKYKYLIYNNIVKLYIISNKEYKINDKLFIIGKE